MTNHRGLGVCVTVAMIAALLTAGCGRSPDHVPKPSATQRQQKISHTVDREQDEATRLKWRERAGPKLAELLDREFGEWEMLSLKQLEGTRFAVIHVLDPERGPYFWVAVSPSYQLVVKTMVMAHGVHLNGLYDVDGDGHKDAAFWVWSGGNGGYDTCVFIKLRPEPRVLGGNDFCPVNCGRPRDIDGDGRTEFEALDTSFSSQFDDLTIPLIYGYREGRFVDLTPSLGRRLLRECIAGGRRKLRAQPNDTRPLYETKGHLLLTKWYVCARLLGEQETTVLRKMKAVAPTTAWNGFMDDLPLVRESLEMRADRFFHSDADFLYDWPG